MDSSLIFVKTDPVRNSGQNGPVHCSHQNGPVRFDENVFFFFRNIYYDSQVLNLFLKNSKSLEKLKPEEIKAF